MRQCSGNGENAASPAKPPHCNWPSSALAKLNWAALKLSHASAHGVRDERLRFASAQAMPLASPSAANTCVIPPSWRVFSSLACRRLYCGRTWVWRFSCVVARSPKGAANRRSSPGHHSAALPTAGHRSVITQPPTGHHSVITQPPAGHQSVNTHWPAGHQSVITQPRCQEPVITQSSLSRAGSAAE